MQFTKNYSEKKPINLITMSMNLFKICYLGFVKFYADFVYIKAILSLHDISSVEQWTEMVQFYLWKGISWMIVYDSVAIPTTFISYLLFVQFINWCLFHCREIVWSFLDCDFIVFVSFSLAIYKMLNIYNFRINVEWMIFLMNIFGV